MSIRRTHMDCTFTKCLVGDVSPCLIFDPPGPEFRRIIANKTPNPIYHEHMGDLIQYVFDLDGDLLAEIRWDTPAPIANLSRQLMRVNYLNSLDGEPLVPHLIQEEA